MFTKDFWNETNEFAYRALNNGIPSPVCGGFRVEPTADDDDRIILDAFELSPIAALLEKREALAEEIPTARGRKLTDRIHEMDRINRQLRDLGYFPAGM